MVHTISSLHLLSEKFPEKFPRRSRVTVLRDGLHFWAQLFDWLADWLNDWLTDCCLTGWLTDWRDFSSEALPKIFRSYSYFTTTKNVTWYDTKAIGFAYNVDVSHNRFVGPAHNVDVSQNRFVGAILSITLKVRCYSINPPYIGFR